MHRLGVNSVVYVAALDKRTYFFLDFGVFLLNLTPSYNLMEIFSQLHVSGGVESVCEDAYGQESGAGRLLAPRTTKERR